MSEIKLGEQTHVTGKLHIELRGPDGNLKQEIFTDNLVTTVGLTHIADQMNGKVEAVMSHMAVGTNGAGGVHLADTVLNTELDRNALTSKTHSVHDVIYVGDWAAADATGTLTEAGIFNNATPGLGTLLCHAAFTAIIKGALDTLKITWTLSFA